MNPKNGVRNFFIAVSGITAANAEMEIVATAPPAFRIVAAGESSPALQQLLANVNPWGLALHPDTGVVYCSDPTAGIIGSIDPATVVPTVTQIITRPGAVFHGIALDAPGNRLFFLDSADNSVNVVNLATLVETQIVSGLGITRPNDIAYDPVRNWILFTESGADGIGIIKTDQPVTNFQGIVNASTVGAWGIAVHPGDGTIYFSSHDNGAIYQLDPDTGVSTAFATGLKGPRGLKFDRFGRLFCLESGEDRVVQVLAPGMTATAPVFGKATNGRAFLVFEGSDKDGDFLPDVWEKRFETSVLVLDDESDPDMDGRSAFNEFFFNASPATGADPAPVRTFTPLPGGGLSLSFQAPSTGYQPQILLSSDMENWQLWTGAVTQSVLADPLYSTFQMILTDPESLELNPKRIFTRLTGSPITP
jgi:streptogramin lyase